MLMSSPKLTFPMQPYKAQLSRDRLAVDRWMSAEEYDDIPTEEDLRTLRRVSGKIKWTAYTVAFAELAERFSYYGSSILYTNFVQWPLPEGSRTGAAGLHGQPGALGMGQSASQGISLFNTFFA
jgi:POT family proton-dependent oligopeptide transporter